MKLNLNNVNKKIVLIFSLFGFILSLISGFLAGNTFINLFFKSIFSGALIGGLITVVNIVIMIYLPELLEDVVQTDGDSADVDGQVDIVMPEEQYTVQGNYDDGNVETEDSDSSETDSSFKEVDLDNLKNLSSFDSSENGIHESSDDFKEDIPYSVSKNKGPTDFGGNSIEDMTKAVKTVLKKE